MTQTLLHPPTTHPVQPLHYPAKRMLITLAPGKQKIKTFIQYISIRKMGNHNVKSRQFTFDGSICNENMGPFSNNQGLVTPLPAKPVELLGLLD